MKNPWQLKFLESWPAAEWQSERLLIAVSGGADSVALFRLILDAGFDPARTTVVTFDHQLRDDSKDDVAFVKELAAKFNVQCIVGTASVKDLANQTGDGIETAARNARYDWLRATAKQIGARYVVTAHTANDQVETILHRVLRGTGIAGLSGMPRVRLLAPDVSLIRPLIEFERDELRDYLNSIAQTWREDPSNLSLDFTRNKLRLELLPLLEREYNSDVNQAILRLGNLAKNAQSIVDLAVDQQFSKLVGLDHASQCATVRIDGFVLTDSLNEFMISELCVRIWKEMTWPRQQMTMRHWQELAEFICASISQGTKVAMSGPQQDFPDHVRAKKTAAGVLLQRLR